jgi:hypothetical protein
MQGPEDWFDDTFCDDAPNGSDEDSSDQPIEALANMGAMSPVLQEFMEEIGLRLHTAMRFACRFSTYSAVVPQDVPLDKSEGLGLALVCNDWDDDDGPCPDDTKRFETTVLDFVQVAGNECRLHRSLPRRSAHLQTTNPTGDKAGPAERSGLVAVGDFVIAVNGVNVTSTPYDEVPAPPPAPVAPPPSCTRSRELAPSTGS